MFSKLKISQRLYIGFAALILLLGVAVATTIWQVGSIDAVSTRISTNRMPAALTAQELMADLNAASGALRGYLLTKKEAMRAEFDSAWKDIDEASATMETIVPSFTNPENVKRWSQFTALRDEYRKAQADVLAIANQPDVQPAIALNSKEGSPRMAALTAILIGELAADGTRAGGMVDNQRELLRTDAATVANNTSFLLYTQWILLAVGVLLGAGVSFVTARGITRPILGMTSAMGDLADGELETEVPGRERGDEIGDMAAAVEVFKQNAIKVRELNAAEEVRTGQTRERANAMASLVKGLGEVVDAAVDGDFSRRIDVELKDGDLMSVANERQQSGVDGRSRRHRNRRSSIGARADRSDQARGRRLQGRLRQAQIDTNAVVDNLAKIVEQLRDTSGALKSATGEILAGTNDLAERTTKQAAAIEETSAAMEQLATTVVDNAKRAESASAKAQVGLDHRRTDRRSDAGVEPGDGAHLHLVAEDLQHHRHDRRHRLPDQPAGAQRLGRSGAGRRCRQGLCGGRRRSPASRPERRECLVRGEGLDRAVRRRSGGRQQAGGGGDAEADLDARRRQGKRHADARHFCRRPRNSRTPSPKSPPPSARWTR